MSPVTEATKTSAKVEPTEDRNLFPESRVKGYLASLEYRIASDALPVLDQVVKELLSKAGSRAKANGRATIQAQDL